MKIKYLYLPVLMWTTTAFAGASEEMLYLDAMAYGYTVEVTINGEVVTSFSDKSTSRSFPSVSLNQGENNIAMTVREIENALQGNLSLRLRRGDFQTMFQDIPFKWRPRGNPVGEHQFTFSGKSQVAKLRERGISPTGAENPERLGKALAQALRTENYADFLHLVHPKIIHAYRNTPHLPTGWDNIRRNTRLDEGSDSEARILVSLNDEISILTDDDFFSPVKASGTLRLNSGYLNHIAEKGGDWFLVIYVPSEWKEFLEAKERTNR